MQLIETKLVRVLIPDKGCLLVNKSTNTAYNKVYLGINDSPDNYAEIVDEEYLNSLKEIENKIDNNQECNDLNIDVLLLSIAKLYEMFEPFLGTIPMTLDMNELSNEKTNPLVIMYLHIVQRGLMDLDEIPDIFKDEVKNLL